MFIHPSLRTRTVAITELSWGAATFLGLPFIGFMVSRGSISLILLSMAALLALVSMLFAAVFQKLPARSPLLCRVAGTSFAQLPVADSTEPVATRPGTVSPGSVSHTSPVDDTPDVTAWEPPLKCPPSSTCRRVPLPAAAANESPSNHRSAAAEVFFCSHLLCH